MYRSRLELFFDRWCDRNDKVLTWGSESIVVQYLSPKDGKMHKYFIDGVLHLQTPNGVKKYIVEIKPYKQTLPPSVSKGKKHSSLLYEQIQWAVNSKKWESARFWAKEHGYEFIFLTEKELKSNFGS